MRAASVSLGLAVTPLVKSAPECVRPVDATRKQRKRFDKCKKGLDCEDTPGFYGCFNDSGDEFATCNESLCEG